MANAQAALRENARRASEAAAEASRPPVRQFSKEELDDLNERLHEAKYEVFRLAEKLVNRIEDSGGDVPPVVRAMASQVKRQIHEAYRLFGEMVEGVTGRVGKNG